MSEISNICKFLIINKQYVERINMKWTNKGHQLEDIGEKIKDKKKIFIYGAGENGRYVFERLKFLNCIQEIGKKTGGGGGFIDADEVKQKYGYLGCRVYSLEEVLREKKEEILIIIAVSKLNKTNVVKKLITNGFAEGEHFLYFDEFIDVYLPIYAAYRFGKVFYKGVCLIPTRKCTLNCQHCLNFIPYVKEPTEDDIEDVKEELDRLFSCIDCLGILSISGGEIFLYSQYKELFRYIGERFRNQIVTLSITTSASIVPDDETYRLFAKYGFTVHVSDYRQALPGIEKNYRKFVEKLKEYQVEYVLFENHEWLDLNVFREEDMFLTEHQRIEHFDACGIPWSYYRDSKLWQCNWAGFAVMSGVKDGCETDYYDLRNCTAESIDKDGRKKFVFYQEKHKELMEFGFGYSELGYVQMCSKCNGYSTINHHFVPPAVQIPKNYNKI